jgi:prevent-host-death family protein
MEKVARLRHRYLLTRDGQPQAVLMAAAEYEEWVETIEILKDRGLMQQIRGGLADLDSGRLRRNEDVFGRPLRATR